MKTTIVISGILAFFFIGCSQNGGLLPGEGKPQSRTIVVRDYNSKKVQSTYALDERYRVSTATYVNEFGSTVVESYDYDLSGNVSRIDRSTRDATNKVDKAETISINKVRSANGDVARKVKTVTPRTKGTGGQEIVTQYYYQNGKPVGMTQTDGYGNTIAKDQTK